VMLCVYRCWARSPAVMWWVWWWCVGWWWGEGWLGWVGCVWVCVCVCVVCVCVLCVCVCVCVVCVCVCVRVWWREENSILELVECTPTMYTHTRARAHTYTHTLTHTHVHTSFIRFGHSWDENGPERHLPHWLPDLQNLHFKSCKWAAYTSSSPAPKDTNDLFLISQVALITAVGSSLPIGKEVRTFLVYSNLYCWN